MRAQRSPLTLPQLLLPEFQSLLFASRKASAGALEAFLGEQPQSVVYSKGVKPQGCGAGTAMESSGTGIRSKSSEWEDNIHHGSQATFFLLFLFFSSFQKNVP